MTCSFEKFGCSIGIFLRSAHLICRNTDISKCFRESLRLRDNESRLFFLALKAYNGITVMFRQITCIYMAYLSKNLPCCCVVVLRLL